MEIRDRNVVVTGGGSGIGRALCERFAAEGARAVTVADLDAESAGQVAEAIGGRSSRVDVASREDIETLVREVEAEAGPIDLFVSNAGITITGGPDADVSLWQKLWDVNVMSHVHAAQALLPGMLERGEGYLLNTCSAAGLLTQIGSAPYTTTKHAAVGFAEWLSVTYGDRGIRVSALCPEAVRTPMSAEMMAQGLFGTDGVMEPEELAEVVVQGLAEERFLILPHERVSLYMQRKAGDIDRWLKGMRRLQARMEGGERIDAQIARD
jgi:NAD(P)-dependent dehydrogenase (short-subunit alcohol dehydrogenase family)